MCAALVLVAAGCADGGGAAGETDPMPGAEASSESGGGSEASSGSSGGEAGFCGDGRVDPGEACDLGVGNEVGAECTPLCVPPTCGDGLLAAGEVCDDGNTDDGDGCSSDCRDEAAPVWSSRVDGADADEVLSAIVAVPEGYVAVGTRAHEFTDVSQLAVAFDHEGGVRWIDEVDDGVGRGTLHDAVAVGSDVIAAGSVPGDEDVATLWRWDADGKRVWTRALDVAADDAVGIGRAASGDILVAASTRPPVADGGGPWIVRVDPSDGSTLAVQSLQEHSVVEVHALDVADDGSFAVVGIHETVPSATTWIGRFSADGELAWEASFSDGYEQLEAVALAPTGWVYAAGGIIRYGQPLDRDITIYGYDDKGQRRWREVLGTEVYAADGAYGAEVDADGDVWIVGTMRDEGHGDAQWAYDAWVRRYAPDGELLWSRTYDGDLHGSDWAQAIAVGDEVVVAGTSPGRLEAGNPWIAAYDPATPAEAERAPPAGSMGEPVPRTEQARSTHRGTLFIDFDGGTLTHGDWGPRGEVPCISGTFEYPAYFGTREQADTIVDTVRLGLRPFGIRVIAGDPPPDHLPYTTVFVGGTAEAIGLEGGVSGYACVVDCGDVWSRDVAFAFDGSELAIARNVLHEAAHTWGLDHVVSLDALMHPFVAGGMWAEECEPLSRETSAIACADRHVDYCEEGAQHSAAELHAVFGGPIAPVDPPTAIINAPATGTIHTLGEPIEIDVHITGSGGDPGARLVIDTLGWSRPLAPDETAVQIHLPAGSHTIRLDVIDQAARETSDEVEVEVIR